MSIEFRTLRGILRAVNGVDLTVGQAEVLAIVGETGCGKSVTARALTGLLDRNAEMKTGEILLAGRQLANLNAGEWRRIRGKAIGMVFQDPLTSFDPVYPVGVQFMEYLRAYEKISTKQARSMILDALATVRLGDPERVCSSLPSQLSGGMRQRVMIAMATILHPLLLIADEPTTSLDVTVQAGILRELQRLKQTEGCAMIVITHDLGVVAELADRVAVMYAGRIVETGSVFDIFHRPAHPYTTALLRSFRELTEDGYLKAIPGELPDPVRLPPGCSFAPRCCCAEALCHEKPPRTVSHSDGRTVSCCCPLST